MKNFSRTFPKGGSASDSAATNIAIGIAVLIGIGYLIGRSFWEWGSDAAIAYLLAAAILLILI